MNDDDAHPFDAEALAIESLSEEARQEVLSAYLDDALSPVAARHVTAWLDAHPAALREIEHLRRTWDLLDLYEDEPVPPAFVASLLERLGIGGASRVSPRLRFGLVAAAAALLAALGLALLRPGAPDPAPVEKADVGLLDEVPGDLLPDVDLLLSLSDEEFHGVLLDDADAP